MKLKENDTSISCNHLFLTADTRLYFTLKISIISGTLPVR